MTYLDLTAMRIGQSHEQLACTHGPHQLHAQPVGKELNGYLFSRFAKLRM
jgi:hypothetical protein